MKPDQRPRVVAHRGAESVRPENTIEAFEVARSLGADAIEFDVHRTSDGVFVVHHDFLLDRTTSGRGLVSEHDVASVRSLDAGSWFAAEFAGLRVPLLEEVLSLASLDFELELELKGFWPSFMHDVVAEVQRAGVFERTEFTSSNLLMLQALKAAYPSACVGVFNFAQPSWMPDPVYVETVLAPTRFADFDVIHVPAKTIKRSIADAIHEAGYMVHANDAITEAEVLAAIDAGADKLSTPDVAMAITVSAS
jgi:glycerophosphoryl diester phosphodiesterase